ncbi:MAG TPA: hypothetical protein VEB68_05515 [Croceibacterium sp.]|nr:hypothetical protein [Croceibacterium sp.]
MPTITALRAVNFVALALLTGVALAWMAAGGFGRAGFFLAPVTMLGEVPAALRMVTPDLLCVSLAVAGLAALRRGPWPLAAGCCALATLERPDFVLFPAALLGVALVARSGVRAAAGCLGAAALAYAATMLAGDHPGWWVHFSVSLIERPADFAAAPPFSLDAYLRAFARANYGNLATQGWPALALLLAACWLLLRERWADRQADLLFAALLLSLAARCVVFPMPDDRLYLPTVMMLAMLVAERWGRGPRRPAAR